MKTALEQLKDIAKEYLRKDMAVPELLDRAYALGKEERGEHECLPYDSCGSNGSQRFCTCKKEIPKPTPSPVKKIEKANFVYPKSSNQADTSSASAVNEVIKKVNELVDHANSLTHE